MGTNAGPNVEETIATLQLDSRPASSDPGAGSIGRFVRDAAVEDAKAANEEIARLKELVRSLGGQA